jgi:signal transduction histidine kinase
METNKSVRIDVSPHLPLLQADEEKVFRIFLNLLANAMKFTRAGDVITLSAKILPDQGMECRVEDSGPGIAADRLKTIFQPFHSKSGASTIDVIKQQGSGLGLSLVKALVEGTRRTDSGGIRPPVREPRLSLPSPDVNHEFSYFLGGG